MSDFIHTPTESIGWGVRPCRGESDASFVRTLTDRKPSSAARLRRTRKIIEVNGEPAGLVVLRKTKYTAHIVDLRFVEEWQWRGIEVELVDHLKAWAKNQGRILVRPAPSDFPAASTVRDLIPAGIALPPSSGPESSWWPSAWTWFQQVVALVAVYLVFRQTGLYTRTTITSDLFWIRPAGIQLILNLLLTILLGGLVPGLVGELRGRLGGGRVIADLGTRFRIAWFGLATVLLAAALGCFATGGLARDGGGAVGTTLLIPATLCLLFAVRRGQLRERGVLRAGFPGFARWDDVLGWSRVKNGLVVSLGRHVPGAPTNRIRVPDRPEIADTLRDRLGEPSPPPPRQTALYVPLFILGSVLFGGINAYLASVPTPRAPGIVGFNVAEKAVLDIGAESRVELFPYLWDEEQEAWAVLDTETIDMERETIGVVLQAVRSDGRPIETALTVDRYG